MPQALSGTFLAPSGQYSPALRQLFDERRSFKAFAP